MHIVDHDMGHKLQTMIDYAFADLEGNARNVTRITGMTFPESTKSIMKEMNSPLRLALRSEIHLHSSIFSSQLQSYLSSF